MITLPNGKICMNEQEAIQWLLDNCLIPFQCSANYAPNSEIGLGTIVNPTPAKVKVGSIIFFADSKVSTVIEVNATSFKCSEQYNDLVDDVVYVQNVAINASGHLICVLSNGTNIDAGLIKQISYFAIDASQHLIVNYNDGTATDLGAIFSGNVNISGNLTADSIIENMSGYSFVRDSISDQITLNVTYAGVVKNGNKITFVWAFEVTRIGSVGSSISRLGNFRIPAAVGAKLIPYTLDWSSDILQSKDIQLFDSLTNNVTLHTHIIKDSNTEIGLFGSNFNSALTQDVKYIGRAEATFLLSDSLAA